jgi:hypothetical protein
MKDIIKNLESKVTELEAKNAQQDSLLSDLLREKNERIAAKHFEFASMRSNQSAVAVNGLPSSCDDLKLIGHTLNGFYSIIGSAMMESVYCNFNKLPSDPGKHFIFYFDWFVIQRWINYLIFSKDFQKWIGYADVKSAPVHFYVQRNSNFNTKYTPIPFDLARVNEGNAMDLTTGIFTAPRNGIYFFSFSGLADFPTASSEVGLGVILYLNGERIGAGYVEESNTVANQNSPLTVQSTLNLKSGDQVWMEIDVISTETSLNDNSYNHNNHFTGFMLEEEIVASLWGFCFDYQKNISNWPKINFFIV